MKKNNKINKKKIIIGAVILLILILLFLVYKSLFSNSDSSRYSGIENHKLEDKEIVAVEKKLKELENVESTDIYITSKIIKIIVKLNDDVDFESIKIKANEAISGFSKNNLEYYDVEIFVESSDKDSEIYPQIGYKFKTNSEFSW